MSIPINFYLKKKIINAYKYYHYISCFTEVNLEKQKTQNAYFKGVRVLKWESLSPTQHNVICSYLRYALASKGGRWFIPESNKQKKSPDFSLSILFPDALWSVDAMMKGTVIQIKTFKPGSFQIFPPLVTFRKSLVFSRDPEVMHNNNQNMECARWPWTTKQMMLF